MCLAIVAQESIFRAGVRCLPSLLMDMSCHPAENEVHVWRICADDWRDRNSQLKALLTDAALTRAERFYYSRDRFRYVVAHGVMCLILAHSYLRVAPKTLVFGTAHNGKPHLIGPSHKPPLFFNLTHSADIILLAVAAAEVGVDVERIRENICWEDIAGHAFSRCEQRQLANATPERRPELFFNGWSRKEAFLKARGDGLSFPLDAFSVSLEPDNARLLEVPGDTEETQRWTMSGIDIGPSYCAATVLKATACRYHLINAHPRCFPY